MINNLITLVIGKNSNLSIHLNNSLNNIVIVSTLEIKSYLKNFINTKINIIFNNFQSAIKLNDLSNPSEYIYRSIQSTADILELILKYNIQVNKFIYTSSSAVYGNNIYGSEIDQAFPLNLHATLKLSNEKLIEKFANENNIHYIITRIYNMYGGNDDFSVISKIIKASTNLENLMIVNKGNAIRDFIHIDDVVFIYKQILLSNYSGILNIGTGEGYSIKGILDFLANHNIFVKTTNIMREELKISTANNEKLLNLLGNYKFRNLHDFILSEVEGAVNE